MQIVRTRMTLLSLHQCICVSALVALVHYEGACGHEVARCLYAGFRGPCVRLRVIGGRVTMLIDAGSAVAAAVGH